MSDDEAPESELETEEVTIVLAAIDTSALASRVVEMAARLARRTWRNAQLHVLHVYKAASFDRPSAAGLKTDDLVAEAQSYLDYHVRVARRQCPAPVTGHLAVGDPVEEILKRSRSLSADVLVTGTHDTAGLERFLLGSVADKIAKRAPCSVLVVRQKQRPYTKIT
ncbi:MAG TPA: universal stress protein [Polyangiaceae bacterium]|jgi:universal stress protein A